MAEIESGTKNIASESSSAFGPFQIMPNTWTQYKSHPRIGLSDGDRYDPYRQPVVAAKIESDATEALRATLPGNVNPTPPELYLAHVFGVDAAKIILQPLVRILPIDQALLRAYANDANPQEKATKAIAAKKDILTSGGQPLIVDTILTNVGTKLKEALAASVPPDIAKAIDDPLSSQVAVAMAVSGNTRYWIVNLSGDEEGGQVLVKQSGDADPIVITSDTVLLPVPAGLVPADVAEQLNKSSEGGAVPGGPAGPPLPAGSDPGPLILATAQAQLGKLKTGNVPNTQNGNLACAWAVNEIARLAIGKSIGGDLSTDGMFKALQAHREIQEAQLSGGCIVISPRVGDRPGHVGIVGNIMPNLGDTKVYSNCSSQRVFCDKYTIASWKSYFGGRGLSVHFFKLLSPPL